MAFLHSTVHRITWMMIDGLWLGHLLKAEPVSSGSSCPLGLPFHAWRRPFFPHFFDDFPFWKHVCMFSLNHRVCASGHSSKFCCEHLPCVHNTVSLFLIYDYSCLFRFRLNPCVMLRKVYADSPTRHVVWKSDCYLLATFGVYFAFVILGVSVTRSIFQRSEFLYRTLPESGYKSPLSPLMNSHLCDEHLRASLKGSAGRSCNWGCGSCLRKEDIS